MVSEHLGYLKANAGVAETPEALLGPFAKPSAG